MADEMVVLTVDKIERESEKAIAVTNTKGGLEWLPKSQIEIVHGKDKVAIHVPKWLADQKQYLEFEDY